MSEIKKLTIENFQSHRKTELEPAPAGQLTVIVGPSDSGKTAIIRALKWLLYNRPQGDGFTRVGASFVRVALTTDKGTVNRHRSSAVNRYLITGEMLPPVPLEGFGNDVPLEVQEITGVRQTMIGDMPLNLNLAEQLDGPFLGSSISDPVRARILGKLAGTEEVDFANKQLGTDLYRRNQDLKRADEEAQRLQGQLEQFEHLPRLREMVAELGQVIEQACAGMNRSRALKSLSVALRDREAQAERWRGILTRLAGVDEAEELYKQAGGKAIRRQLLDNMGARWRIADGDCKRLTQQLEALEDLVALDGLCRSAAEGYERLKRLNDIYALLRITKDWKREVEEARDRLTQMIGPAEADYKKAAELIQRLRPLDVKSAAYAGQGLKLTCARDMIVRYEKEVARYTGAYRDALLAAGQCPTCGGQIDPEKLKEVI